MQLGQSPMFYEGCRYHHLSATSAITPVGDLVCQIQENKYKGKDMVGLLKKLLDTFLIKNCSSFGIGHTFIPQRGEECFGKRQASLYYLAKIPPYSPELKPMSRFERSLNVICFKILSVKT